MRAPTGTPPGRAARTARARRGPVGPTPRRGSARTADRRRRSSDGPSVAVRRAGVLERLAGDRLEPPGVGALLELQLQRAVARVLAHDEALGLRDERDEVLAAGADHELAHSSARVVAP